MAVAIASSFVEIVSRVSPFVTLVAFSITILTFLKVRSVSRTQKNERALLRDLIGFSAIVQLMSAASRKLDSEGSKESAQISDELKDMIGRISGASDVLYRSEGGHDVENVPIKPGYFSDKFLEECFSQTSKSLDILTFRALFLVNAYSIEKIQFLCRSGVKVRILSFSSEAPEEALRSARRFITIRPQPSSANVYRQQLKHSEDYSHETVMNSWSEKERNNFDYKVYKTAPTAHFVKTDRTLHMGFVGVFNDCYPMRLVERMYASFNLTSAAAQSYIKHFDCLWEESNSVIFRENETQ